MALAAPSFTAIHHGNKPKLVVNQAKALKRSCGEGEDSSLRLFEPKKYYLQQLKHAYP